MEHWARQQIVKAIIMAEVKCLNSKGRAMAVPAGEAADEIIDLLFGPPKYNLPGSNPCCEIILESHRQDD